MTPRPGNDGLPRPRAWRPAGFTMIEMVTSCAILSLLMLALGYGLQLAIVSTGNGAAQAAATIEATSVVERITDDMNEALDFTEKTRESVTFTVPRRGATTRPADGTEPTPDEVRYKWWPVGGTHGEGEARQTFPAYAVTRQLNGGTPSVLGRDVRAFDLDYLYRSMSPPAAAADWLLLEHNPSSGIGTPTEFQANTTRWMGETFKVPLSGDTTSFAITRIALYLRADATLDGLLLVRVFPADAATNVPLTSQPLETVWVAELALANATGWVDVPFQNLTSLNPAQKYCVLVSGTGTAASYHGIVGYVRHLSQPLSTILAPNTYLVQTTTGTAPWTNSSLNSLRYKVYGTSRQ